MKMCESVFECLCVRKSVANATQGGTPFALLYTQPIFKIFHTEFSSSGKNNAQVYKLQKVFHTNRAGKLHGQ